METLSQLYAEWKNGNHALFPVKNTPEALCKLENNASSPKASITKKLASASSVALPSSSPSSSGVTKQKLGECEAENTTLKKHIDDLRTALEKTKKPEVKSVNQQTSLSPQTVSKSISTSKTTSKTTELKLKMIEFIDLMVKHGIVQNSDGEAIWPTSQIDLSLKEAAASMKNYPNFNKLLYSSSIKQLLHSRGWETLDFNLALSKAAYS